MRRFQLTCALLFLLPASAAAQTVLCDSPDGTYRECRVGSGGTIRLVTELSEGRCMEGATWGTLHGGVVWVNRGCRATFTVDDPFGKGPRIKTRVICESETGGHKVCPAYTGSGVTLVRQLGTARCVEDVTWGFDREKGQIWVDDGCRGEFSLGPVSTFTPAAPALDSVVVCQSLDGSRKECKADTYAGVQIIRAFTDSACRFGREWGFDKKAIWVVNGCRAAFAVHGSKPVVAAIVCESRNNGRNDCIAETHFGVALVRQLSEDECALDRTWGFDRDAVWVKDGCRAQFALGGYRLPPDAVSASATRIICDSLDGKRNQCAADTTRGVGLVRQIGDTDCVLNRTWGYDRDAIWVSDGCNAEFAVGR